MSIDQDEPQLEHDLRCPELTDPGLFADPSRCRCRDADGHSKPISWADGPMCAFDLETTGQDPETARIVTATVVRIRPGQDKIVTDWLSDVDGEEIPEGAAKIHGVTTEYARAHGRPHLEVVREIRTALELEWAAGIPVVGYNVSYDLTVQARECERAGDLNAFRVAGPVIDPLVLDRACERYRKGSRKLIDVARLYGVELSEEDAHGSAADALAAARVAFKIARKYRLVGDMDLATLQTYQADKHRAWANQFGGYLRSKGKTDDVSRDWPMRSGS